MRMRILQFIALICFIASFGAAGNAQKAPLIVFEDSPQPTQPATATPPAPAKAIEPVVKPTTETKPAVPTPTSPPADKLWPSDTVQIFLPPCTGFRPQFVPACTCIITRLMAEMPHDEFLQKSNDNSLEQDPRLIKIRTECVTVPQRKG
jgi:hypothetical protein